MPPKKKKTNKKVTRKMGRRAVIIDGIPLTEMTKIQLEEHVVRLRDELDREREERNFFQVERDKICSFWEITKEEIEKTRSEVRNRDRDVEEAEERHLMEIKIYKQKVKHLMYEHEKKVSELATLNTRKLQKSEEEFCTKKDSFLKDNSDLKINLKEQERSHITQIRNIEMKHCENIGDVRREAEERIRNIEDRYEKKTKDLASELDLRRRNEIHEIEERKNSQISDLIRNHDKAITEMKNYYTDITQNNLALINTMKDQLADLRKLEERLQKQVQDLQEENTNLKLPLQQAQEELQVARQKLANFERDSHALTNSKLRLRNLTKNVKQLNLENEVLLQKCGKLEEEKDFIYEQFQSAIQTVQQKSGLKASLLEKKLTSLRESLEKRNAQLVEAVSASNLDPVAFSALTSKLEDVLKEKNGIINELHVELAKVCKAYNYLLETYETEVEKKEDETDYPHFQPLTLKEFNNPSIQ